MNDNFIKSSFIKEDNPFEMSLRPVILNEFVGQELVKQQIKIILNAAINRKEALGHCILSGPPGLGKTTLAHIISKTIDSNLKVISGPTIEKPSDLAGILTSLEDKDILFIDEIHRLSKNVEEYLYPAMEDFKLDLIIDGGANARSVCLKLNKFTLIGATTKIGLLSSPMLSRFLFTARLDFYKTNELIQIIKRSAAILNLPIDEKGANEIAKRARGTPRIANNFLRWVRDYMQIDNDKIVTLDVAKNALKMLCIDDLGLDEMDRKILSIIINDFDGGPVGLDTLSTSLAEEKTTISYVYEPYLIRLGFIKRTLKGREATQLAYKHINKHKGR